MSRDDTKHLNIMPVILAGGMGMRLRPITAPSRPKPFLHGFHEWSLFQNTLKRAEYFAAPVIATHTDYAPNVFEQCYETGIKPYAILCEPTHRNTAMSIACAAHIAMRKNARMLVMPSDHYIADTRVFHDTVRTATQYAHDFVCITAKPKSLSSRYGYIVSDKDNQILQFSEKPKQFDIKTLAQKGQVAWNTGIFVCKPEALLNILARRHPVLYDASKKTIQRARIDKPFVFPEIDTYLTAPRIAIDYAVMEHITRGMTVPLSCAWSDIGTRNAFLNYALRALKTKLQGNPY